MNLQDKRFSLKISFLTLSPLFLKFLTGSFLIVLLFILFHHFFLNSFIDNFVDQCIVFVRFFDILVKLLSDLLIKKLLSFSELLILPLFHVLEESFDILDIATSVEACRNRQYDDLQVSLVDSAFD